MGLYVQYGCGLSAPSDWINFDSSPTLQMQKIPLLGKIVKKVNFPSNVLYGDIVKGLPNIKENTCDGIYCSHVLEHLSLNDCKQAIKETFSLLKNDGVFRCVLPDLEFSINNYIINKSADNPTAAIHFLQSTMLGIEDRPKGFKNKLIALFGNSHHLWMWDKLALQQELLNVGFKKIRLCEYNDSTDVHFKSVEEENRFYGAIAFECIK